MSVSSTRATWVLLPVKEFARSKSRLKQVLADASRAALARSLCEHSLCVLAQCPELAGVLVVTECAQVAKLAQQSGAHAWMRPPPGPSGLKEVVDAGLRRLCELGAASALVLMSDLPYLSAEDVRTLLVKLRDCDMVIAPDERSEGTNALAVKPPDLVPTCFGTYDSFTRHFAAAKQAGLEVGIHRAPGLLFDLDRPEDLSRYESRFEETSELKGEG